MEEKYLFLAFVYQFSPGGPLCFTNLTVMADAMSKPKEYAEWFRQAVQPSARNITLIGLTVLTKQEYIEMGGKLPDEDKI